MIQVFNTYIHPDAKEFVNDLLKTTFLSEGELVKDFERGVESTFGVTNCVALNSGTSALHLALILAGVSTGDEVIIPAQTFIATGLAVLYQNAIPVFTDIDPETGNISVNDIAKKITRKTKAIIPVHWGGYPCDLDEINKLAKAHGIVVIEDAAHALGAIYKEKAIGTISDITCFSFQAIKHLTTGDGGAVCFTDGAYYDEALTRRWFGIDRKNSIPSELGERNYDVKEIGYKYHMNNYAAALGLANLKGLADRMKAREKLAAFYTKELSNFDGIELFNYNPDRKSAYWLFGFHVKKRLDFIRKLKSKNITASVVHQRIDRNSVFGGMTKGLIGQEKFEETQIHIPIHDAVTRMDAEYIVQTIKEGW